MRLSFYSGLAAAMIAASDTVKASERDMDENQLAQAEARDIRTANRGWNLAQSDSLSEVPSTMESDLGADNAVEANSDVDVDTGSEVTTENEVGTESEVDLDTQSEAEVSTDTELLNENNNEADAEAEAQAFADIGSTTESNTEAESETLALRKKMMKPKKIPAKKAKKTIKKRVPPKPGQ